MDVSAILQEEEQKRKALSVKVDIEREEDYNVDAGNLMISDPRPINLKKNAVKTIKDTTRENLQLLVNRVWELPVEKVDVGVIAKLPLPLSRIPREKPLPEKKSLTKWEEYAQKKGINKKKREAMVYDEMSGEYKPRWGFKRASETDTPWIVLPDQADPYEDQFEKLEQAKKERVAKNKSQQLKNLATARLKSGKSTHTSAMVLDRTEMKKGLNTALTISKGATASAGKYDAHLPGDKTSRTAPEKKKRKPVVGNEKAENEAALNVLKKLEQKSGVMLSTKTGAKAAVADIAQETKHKVQKQGKKRGAKKTGGKKTSGRK